jgi:hypothetical protein
MQFTDVVQSLYSPQDVMKHGLGFLSINAYGKSNQWQTTEFHKHYGSNPLTLANQWFDLCVTDIPEARLNTEDRSYPLLSLAIPKKFKYAGVSIQDLRTECTR